MSEISILLLTSAPPPKFFFYYTNHTKIHKCHFLSRYTLVQVFSKFGKITSVDYLFHKSGPLKGKPRGYAFVKYTDEDVSPLLTFSLSILLCFVLSKELIGGFAFPV